MFTKLYSNITDSTLMEQPINVRYVFMMLLAIADPEGYVASTPKATAARLNMDQDAFDQAIEALSAPDPESNFPDYEGRRLVPSDRGRGWLITTYQHYATIRNEVHKRQYMREYMRSYRAKKASVNINKEDVKSLRITSLALLEGEEDTKEKKTQLRNNGEEAPKTPIFNPIQPIPTNWPE
jgi:hypothetical protein